MEVEKTRQHILTFWLSITNGVEPCEETLSARKHGAQIHEVEQPRKPFQEGKFMCQASGQGTELKRKFTCESTAKSFYK